MDQEKTFTCICLPDKNSLVSLEKLRQDISSSCDSKNALQFPVHFSLRNDFKIKTEDCAALVDSLEKTSQNTESLTLEAKEYGFFPWKIVCLKIKKVPALQKFHEKVMYDIQKFRTSWVPDYLLKNKNDYSKKQLKYIKVYGYQFAFEYYSSHITLAGNDMTDEAFSKANQQLKDEPIAIIMHIDKFLLIDRSDNTIFAEFSLSNSV